MTFNIETYLISLPEDIEEINIPYKKLKYIPNLLRFKNLKRLYCSGNRLTSLPMFNDTLEELYCSDNNLTSLPNFNEKLTKMYCSGNNLTYLPNFNENLEILFCSNNQLSSLPTLNEKLEILYCSNNKLTSLPRLNENLKGLYCSDNNLTSLPNLNFIENLIELDCSNNPICEIIEHSFDIDSTKNKIRILNNFRHLYYCLKFKKQLREWLWKKVREQTIMRRYHPSYLIEKLYLDEETDLDELLNKW